uniref:helix-turn-helix domain-containing protein n=1 Tax=uncultured Bilophila sp. TaxID=529385 RepID=UPI0025E48444|nr:helix-turn-helix domain-containing protein [uncultured Bilophila sp.]
MERHEFDAAYARICEVCGVKTQMELSAYLGIRQSSISDAGRRSAVPAAWLLTILSRERVNPAWILTGEGPRYLVPSSLPPSASAMLMARLSGPELEQRIHAGLMSATECLAGEIRDLVAGGRREAAHD